MKPLAAAATCAELLRVRPGVFSARGTDGESYLLAWPTGEAIGRLVAWQQALLRWLADMARTPDEIHEFAREHQHRSRITEDAAGAGEPTAHAVDALLARLRAGGWLAVTAVHDHRPLYTVVPNRRPPAPLLGATPTDLILSRFATIRRSAGELVAGSPRAWCDIEIHDPAVLPSVCGSPASGALPSAVTDRLRRELWWADLLVPQLSVEDTEFAVSQWAPHELWFHEQSRMGRRLLGDGYGATFWAKGRFDPLPAQHDPFPGPAVDLNRPDLGALRATDRPLTAVLEDRQSIRSHDDANPLTVGQLAEFLYRCARSRDVADYDGTQIVSRPYPAGGGAYELELYPVVRHVSGLEPALYHYDPHAHRLERVSGLGASARRLLSMAATAAGTAGQPQVLVVVAARFGRVMWKYQAMPYALTLKHVGVLFQVMYLVATAMGLAPCALGGGDSTAFTGATGLDQFAESSVGEFMLGSRLIGPPTVGAMP